MQIEPSTLSSASRPKTYSMEQSIKDGLSVDKNVELTADEENVLNNFSKLAEDKDFERMYNDWITNSVLSDKFCEDNTAMSGQEFQDLVKQGRKHWKKNMSFLCDKIFGVTNEHVTEQDLASVLLCEMVATYYAAKMDSIKTDWRENQYTEDGKYICPTIEYFTKQYVKSILEEENGKVNTPLDFENKPQYDNALAMEDRTLVVNLAKEAVVSLQFQNVTTNSSLMLLNSQLMEKGKYVYEIDVLPLASGVNVCTLVVDGKVYSVKLIK